MLPYTRLCVGRWQSIHVRVRKVLDGSRDKRLFKVVARGGSHPRLVHPF